MEIPRDPKPAPLTAKALDELLQREGALLHLDVERDTHAFTPKALDYLREHGIVSVCLVPLVFGGRTVGFFALAFTRQHPVDREHSGILVALAQQATLAIELTRLGRSAQEAAVLVERNRIGQEIHDGLAQAFTGILMQLGAAEELDSATEGSTPAQITSRIRDLAREGLAEARRWSWRSARRDAPRRPRSRAPTAGRALDRAGPRRMLVRGHRRRDRTARPSTNTSCCASRRKPVSNAVRHGEPRHVRISLSSEPKHWELAIADDGRGMDESSPSTARSRALD